MWLLALVVRYLTRRFIGEYDPSSEKVYPHSTCIDGESVFLEILDSAIQTHVSRFIISSRLELKQWI